MNWTKHEIEMKRKAKKEKRNPATTKIHKFIFIYCELCSTNTRFAIPLKKMNE